mmetsp:Transcript_49205/g.148103  ORF Transcript_49205/g.148103 Transcript_49205/m.148103 type:complete len:97 (+) Transcript_49205:710-1000(+)
MLVLLVVTAVALGIVTVAKVTGRNEREKRSAEDASQEASKKDGELNGLSMGPSWMHGQSNRRGNDKCGGGNRENEDGLRRAEVMQFGFRQAKRRSE